MKRTLFSLVPEDNGLYSILASNKSNEAWLKQTALDLLTNQFRLTKITKTRKDVEVIEAFKTPTGASIEVIKDPFFGIAIETSDKEFISTFHKKLVESELS